MKPALRTLIVYNEAESADGDDDPDLISEAAVIDQVNVLHDALRERGGNVAALPLKNLSDDIEKIKAISPDLIINLCEGLGGVSGQEMNVAGLWEALGIPYTGNRPLTLGLAKNKILSKMLFKFSGIPTPAHEVFDASPDRTSLEFPVIVKPSDEDGSLGITIDSIANDFPTLKKLVDGILEKYRQPAIAERYIDGREFNVSILGNTPPRAIGVAEIDFTPLPSKYPRIYGYEAKWYKSHELYQKTARVCPAKISDELRKKLEEIAIKTYKVVGGRDYGRVDFRVDKDGSPFVLEYNPNPDVSPDDCFYKSLLHSGLTYGDFVAILTQEAMARRAH